MATDPLAFDRMVTDALLDHSDQFIDMHRGITPVTVWMIDDSHPAVPALNGIYWLEGFGEHFVGTRRLNSYIVEDAILLRWATEEARSEAAFELNRTPAPRLREHALERKGRALIEGLRL